MKRSIAASSATWPRAAKARSTSLRAPSPTIAAVSASEKPARPRAAISRSRAEARSGTESTRVPSRSSSNVPITLLHSEMVSDVKDCGLALTQDAARRYAARRALDDDRGDWHHAGKQHNARNRSHSGGGSGHPDAIGLAEDAAPDRRPADAAPSARRLRGGVF